MTKFNAMRFVLDACFGPLETGIFTRSFRAIRAYAKRMQNVWQGYGTGGARG